MVAWPHVLFGCSAGRAGPTLSMLVYMDFQIVFWSSFAQVDFGNFFWQRKGRNRIRMTVQRERVFPVRREDIINCKLNQLYLEVEVEK